MTFKTRIAYDVGQRKSIINKHDKSSEFEQNVLFQASINQKCKWYISPNFNRDW